MTFEEVVDQAIAMLQRRGRVTYRMLKRQFQLDDEALGDLTVELIKGQQLATDAESIGKRKPLFTPSHPPAAPLPPCRPPALRLPGLRGLGWLRGLGRLRGLGTILYGWAVAAQGQREAGLASLRQGLTAMDATGSALLRPYYLALLAAIYGDSGQPTAGQAMLADAWALVDKNGERWYAAELHRLQGALLLQEGTPAGRQAEQCFQQALDVARRQQAQSWELRAATSLARLWQQQGKCAEAYDLLAPIYGWFTEGFDTADLQEAKALLDELEA